MKEHAQAVVLESLEAVAAALDSLHAQVQALSRTIRSTGVVVGQDLGPPRFQGVAERGDLLHFVADAAGDGLVQKNGGGFGVASEIHVSN